MPKKPRRHNIIINKFPLVYLLQGAQHQIGLDHEIEDGRPGEKSCHDQHDTGWGNEAVIVQRW